MPRNIEIKARLTSVAALLPTAEGLTGQRATDLHQDDTFFACPHGRLKLRCFADGTGELIFYQRADEAGPKTSHYLRTPVVDPEALRGTLGAALGLVGRVIKHRRLLLAGRTRIHLDEVEGLGSFLELEVVLREDESPETGVAEAEGLLIQLGISRESLVRGSYLDLLQAASNGPV